MGRDRHSVQAASQRASFNSRARMGRDCGFVVLPPQPGVSIHAPAWGATDEFDDVVRVLVVSIHAPAWGATAFVM